MRIPRVRTRQVTYRSADGTEVRMVVISPPEAGGGPSLPRPLALRLACEYLISARVIRPATPPS